MVYRLKGYKIVVDGTTGVVTTYILFLEFDGAESDNEFGTLCDIIKVPAKLFSPSQFELDSDVLITYNRLGHVVGVKQL